MSKENEKTALDILLGRSQEQLSFDDLTIRKNEQSFNELTKSFYEKQNSLRTVTMNELYEQVFQNKPPIIDGLLYPGTYLFVGAPKLGKSFMMLEIGYHISKGIPLWGYSVKQGTVLYLALEDEYQRIQNRLYHMFGTDSTDNLHITNKAEHLNGELLEQLELFVNEYPDTKVIIIDTLQKIRETNEERYSYANDYEVITKLKKFTDQNGICLLLVHHTRKQQSDDRFEMISGTNGLLGAADGAFLLHKDKRTSSEAVLQISGRDQQDQTLYLNRNQETLVWELDKAEMEIRSEKEDPILKRIGETITEYNPTWFGTATELVKILGLDTNANTLTMKLNILAAKLLNDYKILYTNIRNHEGRRVQLEYQKEE